MPRGVANDLGRVCVNVFSKGWGYLWAGICHSLVDNRQFIIGWNSLEVWPARRECRGSLPRGAVGKVPGWECEPEGGRK